MILLDTHALLWWIDNSPKLSQKIKTIIKKEDSDNKILISSMSIWEIALLVKKGRLRLTMDLDSLLERIERLPSVQFVPINNTIAIKSVTLPGDFHADPADRIIVATAREKGAILVTGDTKIQNYPHVQTVW